MFNFKEELEARGLTYAFGTPRLGDFIYQDLNGDKVIDEKDMAPIGYSNLPRQSYNFSAGFKYKGLEFSVLLQGVNKVSTVVGGTVFTKMLTKVCSMTFIDMHGHRNAGIMERK